jgi:hypothetical protein
MAEIQEGIAMALDEYEERGWTLPVSVVPLKGEPTSALVPVVVSEHKFIRPRARVASGKQRTR